MGTAPPTSIIGIQGPAIGLSAAAGVAMCLVAGGPPWWAALAFGLGIASIAGLRRSPWAVAALVPLLALPTGSWTVLAACAALGLAVPACWELWQRIEGADERLLLREVGIAHHECGVLQRHLRRYPTLMDTCQSLSSARDPDALADVLCRAVERIVPAWLSIQVYLGTGGRQSIRARLQDPDHEEIEDLSQDIAYVAGELRPLIRRGPINVLACLPLRSERRSDPEAEDAHHRGVLLVRFRSQGAEDVLNLEILHALGRLGGLGLAAVDLVAEAQSLALRDELTGLFGRHEFFRRLQETLAGARREDDPVGVIMCDMDHLKRVNDTFGHATGDEALRLVSKAIIETLPSAAIACRYGGEEFGVLIPPEAAAQTEAIAGALLQAIRSHKCLEAAPDLCLTASLGWAISDGNELPTCLMARADAACYRAKDGGRNRVEAG
jgi:diguanylate cyclase (GGDEF)-like protein